MTLDDAAIDRLVEAAKTGDVWAFDPSQATAARAEPPRDVAPGAPRMLWVGVRVALGRSRRTP